MTQNGSDVAVGPIGQRQQPVFDLDIIMGARQCHAGRRLERPAARIVEPAHKLFQVDRGHPASPGGAIPLFVPRHYVLRGTIVQQMRGA